MNTSQCARARNALALAALWVATASCAHAAEQAATPASVLSPAKPRVQRANASDRAQGASTTAQTERVRELATDDSAEVTRLLIEIATNTGTSSVALTEAKELLAQRRTGVDFMLEALGKEYDPLSETERPPPVGALADALGAMGDERAAPLLARKLNEPTTPPEDTERAARALVTLATPAQAPQLETFFVLYRGTAHEPALVNAVVAAAKTLLRIGGAHARELVQRAQADWLTQADVRRGLTELAATADGAGTSETSNAL